ncbi:MAG: hypothetical protein AAFU79_06210 [Myxococcota bacterium]
MNPAAAASGVLFYIPVAVAAAGCAPGSAASPPPEVWYDRPLPMTTETARLASEGPVVELSFGIIGSERCRAQPTPCPLLILLPGGAQNINMMQETARPWADGWKRGGWLVLAPAAPYAGPTFYEAHSPALAAWYRYVLTTYAPRSPPALLGVSNGGIAAFRLLASRIPRPARTIVAPGYLPSSLGPLPAGLHIDLVVGAEDAWRTEVEKTFETLCASGHTARWFLIPGTGHALVDLAPEAMVDPQVLSPGRACTP